MTFKSFFTQQRGTLAMRIFRTCSIAITLFAAAHTASAAGLSVTAADIVWNEAVDGPPSGYMKIEILNDGVTDLLKTWTLELSLQQVSGTGTLEFATRSIAVLGSDYLMASNSSGLFGTITPTNVYAFDYDISGPPPGVPVPASGKYLLAVNFSTPDDARGVWNLIATGGPLGSLWSDEHDNELEFANVPFDGTPVVLGSITVVPEPASVAMLATGGAGLLVGAVLRRRRLVAARG